MERPCPAVRCQRERRTNRGPLGVIQRLLAEGHSVGEGVLLAVWAKRPVRECGVRSFQGERASKGLFPHLRPLRFQFEVSLGLC